MEKLPALPQQELPGLKTNHPREVIEVALAHVVDNHVELSYARYDLFDRRRVLIDDRARYLDGRSGEGRESL